MNVVRVFRFLFAALLMGGLLAGSATFSHALPIVVNDFAIDPTSAAFTISAIDPNDGLSNNIAALPVLEYGVTDPTTGVENTLRMNWEPDSKNDPAQAGWELVFGVDPDISNQTLTLSISPPGQATSTGPAGFSAITHLEILVRDANGLSAGIWGFNTDQMGNILLANDPTAAGIAPNTLPNGGFFAGPIASLANNVMQTVTINLGTGPVAGSASISDGFTTRVGPNYTFASAGGSLLTAASLEFYENGSLRGSTALPNVASPGLNNYWDHVSLTPEPSSILLCSMALMGLSGIRMRRR